MNRLFLKMALALFIVLGAASIIIRAIGELRPHHPVMVGLDSQCEGKTEPCRYGVTLDETTTDEVRAIFEQFGDSIINNSTKFQLEIFKTKLGGCFAQFIYGRGESSTIKEIILTNCSRVRLGDVLARYGEPETIGANISCDRFHTLIQHDFYFIEYPTNGIIAVINRPALFRPWLSLQGNVAQLYLVKPRQTDGRKTWSGMVSFERFARLHPEQIRSNSCGP